MDGCDQGESITFIPLASCRETWLPVIFLQVGTMQIQEMRNRIKICRQMDRGGNLSCKMDKREGSIWLVDGGWSIQRASLQWGNTTKKVIFKRKLKYLIHNWYSNLDYSILLHFKNPWNKVLVYDSTLLWFMSLKVYTSLYHVFSRTKWLNIQKYMNSTCTRNLCTPLYDVLSKTLWLH